ncbi:flagellar motor protein MotB [Steroidobacter sp.]|uniref:flagellar motor protein MotB n=1 Tax=Steroidobacter sp. TaxID=1978227 RepID=UPI001A4AAFEF|nr:flagellar motor protein MotB [Steroidobacter sp.]MBL8271945.1 flagellar motor protein MotB [Steroidobacter sp.]
MAKAKSADGELAPIIIKKVKKGGHAHHGGSWKVAFADFATAMMAFFLLMWLMGSTTQEQKGAISEYFNNPSAVPGTSTVPSPTSIQGPGGASTSMIQLGGGMELHTDAASEDGPPKENVTVSDDAAEKRAEQIDAERLNSLMDQLKEAIDAREALAKFKDQILLDITPEGVRIQIVDHDRRSMFPLGSSKLEDYSTKILFELSNIINNVPNRISISGHTDIKPYIANNYSNWELSADRANAARRALLAGGLPPEKVGRVVGLASSVLLDSAVPDSPVNRRISIIVMNRRTEEAIMHENGTLLSVQPPHATDPESAPVAEAGGTGAPVGGAPAGGTPTADAAPAAAPAAAGGAPSITAALSQYELVAR